MVIFLLIIGPLENAANIIICCYSATSLKQRMTKIHTFFLILNCMCVNALRGSLSRKFGLRNGLVRFTSIPAEYETLLGAPGNRPASGFYTSNTGLVTLSTSTRNKFLRRD